MKLLLWKALSALLVLAVVPLSALAALLVGFVALLNRWADNAEYEALEEHAMRRVRRDRPGWRRS